MKLILATTNKGKLKEFQALLQQAKLNLDVELAPAGFDPEETGSTFTENALIKAREAARMTGQLSLADDSGLKVEAMDWRPGIYSARYAPGTDGDRRSKLLQELASIPEGKRRAAFVCALALCDGKQDLFVCEIDWWGKIGFSEAGEHGFGFDPIFIPEGYEITASQMEPSLKNKLSHRGMAFAKLVDFLSNLCKPSSQEAVH
ncbi:MAG: RdgB/HAM1 family non-canonical purine NTP pyrophosphatase [Candidatus Melainabacteria bacterium]|nr:RdgB/HAM1 family non-canonical purine NTP pyrophosphatase [Candidatus Melainabacteria bacterium]